jgi:hypothetical protein
VTLTDTVRALPRAVLESYLKAGRLPLSVAQRLAGAPADESWPPSLAYEGFGASVETLVGSLVRDPALIDKGRLRQAKVVQLRRAAELDAAAAEQREQAERDYAQAAGQAEERRDAAAEAAEQRQRALEEKAERQRREAQQEAARKQASSRRLQASQQQAVERQQRAVRLEALEEEAAAVASTQQALEAERTVEVIEDTLEGTKQARKNG